MFEGLTLQPSDQQIAMRPLMDPVLEGAAFLLHLRNVSCNQHAVRIHRAVGEEDALGISLYRCVWHRVCRPVHQILSNNSVDNKKQIGLDVDDRSGAFYKGIGATVYKHGTYSRENPKFSMTLASAAKILQYSRIMFWTLHSCQHKQFNKANHCTAIVITRK